MTTRPIHRRRLRGRGATAALVCRGGALGPGGPGRGYRRETFTPDLYGALKTILRDFGTQAARGRSLIPVLEGRCVGGSTVANGAIVHKLPEEVHAEWIRDAGIRDRIRFADLDRCAERIETDLGIGANLEPVLADLPAAKAAGRLGMRVQPMRRNAPGCQATGRCLQGCPSGGKLSMEASYIPRAMRAGARVLPGHRVERVLLERGVVAGVRAIGPEGGRTLRARKGLVLAAGAIQTPRILGRSGLFSAHLGLHFQSHPGVGVAAILRDPVRSIEGPPQGIEIFQSGTLGNDSGKKDLKLATQLVPPELLLARAPVSGATLARLLKASDACPPDRFRPVHSRRTVGRACRRRDPLHADPDMVDAAFHRLARLQFELGERSGGRRRRSAGTDFGRSMRRDPQGPADPALAGRHQTCGTCRMGSDPKTSVVGPDFAVHGAKGLYVMDASVFPTNLGVNPQHAIMSMAMLGAERLLQG